MITAATVPTVLATSVGKTPLASLLMNASGCFNPSLFHQLSPLPQCLGAIVTKTVTPQPRGGNPQYRTVELAGVGMLNSIGLQNPGLDYALTTDVPEYASLGCPVVLSVSAETPEAFEDLAHTVAQSAPAQAGQVIALELNLSCPNVAKGGVDFGSNPQTIALAITAARQGLGEGSSIALWAKLTPNVASMLPMAEAAASAGVDAVTIMNTLLGTAIDVKTRRFILPRISGGYSGPGVFPVALNHVQNVHRHFPQLPIVGVGGIETVENVLAMVMAGASAVQVGTACFRSPLVFAQLVDGLTAWCEVEGVGALSALRGVTVYTS